MDYKFNPEENEWNLALKEMNIKENLHINYHYGQLVKNLGWKPLRYIVFSENKPIALMQSILIDYYKFPSYKNISCGGREGNGFFVKQGFSRESILKELIRRTKKKSGGGIISFTLINDKELRLNPSLSYLRHTPVLNLTVQEEVLWKKLNKKTRNEIRQAEQRNVSVVRNNTDDGIGEFYRLKSPKWKDERKTAWNIRLKDKETFKKFYKYAIENKLMSLFFAKVKENTVALAAVYHIDDKIIYATGALDRNFQWNRPVNLLLWKVIKWAKKNNSKELDFCGAVTDENNPDFSRTKFKLGFGAEIKSFPTYVWLSTKIFGIETKAMNLLLKKIWKKTH